MIRRQIVLVFLIILNNTLSAKEWKSLKAYQKETQKQLLEPSDWLKCDRVKNTLIWQQANVFNLKNNLSQEYENISQRRDFYKWFYNELNKKGHEIIWVKMAHFISKKMSLMEVFPYSVFTRSDVKIYANQGSEVVFKNVFIELKNLYNSQSILKTKKALEWDKAILKKEQYKWIESIYKTIDPRSLKTLERIAKGKFLYGLVVPKAIRFKNKLSNTEDRYNYAVEVLRVYCVNSYK